MSTLSLGYTTPLIVLPFDHRGSFAKGLFGTEAPDEETVAKIIAYKHVIYDAIFVAQKTLALPTSETAILVDEIYGEAILKDAQEKGLVILQTTEKSGTETFDFEYADAFGEHLLRYNATFAKALVRFNPDGDAAANAHSLVNLKKLSDFCHANGIKLLIEPLVPATAEQLAAVDGDKRRYDQELRPALTVRMVAAMQEAGIECDVWKIEGFADRSAYQAALAQMRSTEARANVSLIILGRGETDEVVTEWLLAGKNLPGVIGFAVGRTVFWEPLVQYHNGTLTREAAVDAIAAAFTHFGTLFLH